MDAVSTIMWVKQYRMQIEALQMQSKLPELVGRAANYIYGTCSV
jgi:hypothetical protein